MQRSDYVRAGPKSSHFVIRKNLFKIGQGYGFENKNK